MNITRESKTFTQEEQDDLRHQVNEILAAEGLHKTDLAKESGIAYGTFTAWLSGTYQGNNDQVAGKVILWLEGRPKQREAAFRVPRAPGFVETESAMRRDR